jgi:hypothetical protein
MNDNLWRELAQVNRDERAEDRNRLDERWDRLSGEELSPEEEAELRALAETSEEAREAYEAFRPLGPEFHASVVQAIREQANAKTTAEERKDNLLSFPRRLAGWSAAAAAVAAAVLMLFLRLPAAPLPAYVAELRGGDQESRGGTKTLTGRRAFSPGSLLTLDAVPEQSVTGSLEAQAFFVRDGELVPLERKPIVENGVARLQGTVGREIRLPLGEQRLWIIVGRKGEIPPLDELAAEIRASRLRHDDWQAVPFDLRIEDLPSG